MCSYELHAKVLVPPSRAQRIYICRYVVSKCICKISLNTYRFGQSWTELAWPFDPAPRHWKSLKKRNCLKFEFPIRWSFRETCRTKTTQVQTGKIAYRQEKTPEENIYNKCSKKLQEFVLYNIMHYNIFVIMMLHVSHDS